MAALMFPLLSIVAGACFGALLTSAFMHDSRLATPAMLALVALAILWAHQ